MMALWKMLQTWEGWHDHNPGSLHISPKDLWNSVVHTVNQCHPVFQRQVHLRVPGADTSLPIQPDGPWMYLWWFDGEGQVQSIHRYQHGGNHSWMAQAPRQYHTCARVCQEEKFSISALVWSQQQWRALSSSRLLQNARHLVLIIWLSYNLAMNQVLTVGTNCALYTPEVLVLHNLQCMDRIHRCHSGSGHPQTQWLQAWA